ncbi:MAG: class I SAM-dependent rRNA methyltransferase [Erysipelotrichaceae bacterium]|nr:class I SAM-dependent rRNA methyltransferase [Erysipelotrichaceae bacterium]
MKISRDYPQITVTDKGAKYLEGHPWLYDGEVVEISGEHHNGDIVDVISRKGKYLGSGFVSDNSKIRVRIFCRNASDQIDRDFFRRRIEYAWKYRRDVMDDTDSCRVIFGESDGLPGLTVDRYRDVLVTQIVSYGMERIKDDIFQSLLEVFAQEGIEINALYERNDVAIRRLEGLEEYKDYYWRREGFDRREVEITENGIRYIVDYIDGQKTGFFLDQRYNRLLVQQLARGKRVLDCFTHTGSFALNAAKGGAAKVTAVDISESAIEMARRNAELNGLKINFAVKDVFDYLEEIDRKAYDLIILDPPAFTKSRETVRNAYNGYKNINKQAIKKLGKGGYLVSCSCSHFMNRQLFEQMLQEAAREMNVELRQVSFSQQSKDHPILMNVPETDYLKFYITQIV